MERNVLLTITGVLLGVALAILWLPTPAPPKLPDHEYVPVGLPKAPVPAGRRAVVLSPDGKPAIYVDVYLTELTSPVRRIYPAVRTNDEGQFPITVPAGRYRVQALQGWDRAIDREVEIVAVEHPDLELRLETVQLLRLLANQYSP